MTAIYLIGLREGLEITLVVSILVGGGAYATSGSWDDGRHRSEWTGGRPGLIALLVIFAGVALLFTTRFPRGLYDLVLGFDRWVLRVVGYAALMTDDYPPFRLDQGGEERPAVPAAPSP